MVIKLYIDYVSQPSRAVLALCIAAKIPYEVVEISMMAGQVRFASLRLNQLILRRSIR